ncbi:MAG: hypothetical protein ACLP5H_15940 [Desulfomonilaceae bacterium]
MDKPVDNGEELVSIARGTRQNLKFSWTRLNANKPPFFNIRQWHIGTDGEWYPTPGRGLGIQGRELPALFTGVRLAAEKALAEGVADDDPMLLKDLQAIVTARSAPQSKSPLQAPGQLDTESRLDTSVRHQGVDTAKTLHIEGWTVRADKRGFFRGYKKIRGIQKSVYLGKTLDGAEEKIRAADERWAGARTEDKKDTIPW